MVKILFFIPGLSEGGAERVLCSLVNNMDQTKFDITVQTIDEYDPKKYLSDGIHYKAINRCKTTWGRKLFSYWFRLCAELKVAYHFFIKDDYDIEVAYLETGPTKIIAQSTNRKAAKLAWVHCDLSQKEGMETSVDKVRKQYRKFDKVICVSEDTKVGFHKLYGENFDTVVLHNVIDEEEIFSKAEQPIDWDRKTKEKQLLAVGRLTKQKNFAHLIETCGKLKEDGYQFHLNILGEGPEKENLEKKIIALDLEDIVTLRGFISNPYPWMKQSDIIVCSSEYEGLSTVVQEALILGKPVVTTPCTGMKELLGESEFGLITKDSKEGLSDCIERLMTDEILESYYIQMAKKRGNRLLKKEIVFQTETIFESLIEK